MLRLVLLASLLATPAICSAEIFKWVDERGNTGFADDLGKVPEKYRQQAMSTDKVEQAVEVVEKIEPEKTSPRKNDARQEQKSAAEANAKGKDKPLYDGKDGDAWKKDFARLKHEISSLEEQAVGIKERMANSAKLSRGEYLSLQNTARDLDVRISLARKKLATLDEAASRAELPADFR